MGEKISKKKKLNKFCFDTFAYQQEQLLFICAKTSSFYLRQQIIWNASIGKQL